MLCVGFGDEEKVCSMCSQEACLATASFLAGSDMEL